MFFNKSNIVLLIIGYNSITPPLISKASDSRFNSPELVESSVTLGYGVLDFLPTITFCYGTF